MNFNQLKQYIYLVRLNKPIGILLLLWPTLWALWLASAGKPDPSIVIIFILGVILMRSAGCIINDFADRNFDGHVARTRERPLATGKIQTKSALMLFVFLCLCAFGLVLFLNRLTILLAFVGAALTMIYPFMKRFTNLPQFGLGFAYSWGVPMAFAAQTNSIPPEIWIVFFPAALWPVIYDTMYAMVDRNDDLKIGVKSTAILFGQHDRSILALLQMLFIGIFIGVGVQFELRWPYFISIVLAAILCVYQQWLIKDRIRDNCFKAFLNNHWLGLIVFVGIVASYGL